MSSRSSTTDPPRELPEHIQVGRIRRPHGVRGAVLIESESDNPQRFAKGAELWLVPAQGPRRSLRVAASRPHRDGLLVSFEQCEQREDAEALRGATLEVPRHQVPPAPEGTFYYYELVGCRCHDRTLGDLGEVVDLTEDGGGLLLMLEADSGRLLVPFVERFLLGVDVAAGRIELDLPPGLVETCTSKF